MFRNWPLIGEAGRVGLARRRCRPRAAGACRPSVGAGARAPSAGRRSCVGRRVGCTLRSARCMGTSAGRSLLDTHAHRDAYAGPGVESSIKAFDQQVESVRRPGVEERYTTAWRQVGASRCCCRCCCCCCRHCRAADLRQRPLLRFLLLLQLVAPPGLLLRRLPRLLLLCCCCCCCCCCCHCCRVCCCQRCSGSGSDRVDLIAFAGGSPSMCAFYEAHTTQHTLNLPAGQACCGARRAGGLHQARHHRRGRAARQAHHERSEEAGPAGEMPGRGAGQRRDWCGDGSGSIPSSPLPSTHKVSVLHLKR